MKTKGFTLVEVLIYSAILAIFITAAIVFMISVLETTDNLLEKNEVIANQEFVEKKFSWVLGNANGITLPSVNSSSTQLQISGSAANIYPVNFNVVNGQLFLSLANGPAVPITNNRIKVTQFLGEHFSSAQSTSTLKILLSLESLVFPTIRASSTTFYVLPQ